METLLPSLTRVISRAIWRYGNGFVDQADGFVRMPVLVCQDPQKVQCCGVRGLLGKDLPVHCLRRGTSTGLMMLNGGLHRLLKGYR